MTLAAWLVGEKTILDSYAMSYAMTLSHGMIFFKFPLVHFQIIDQIFRVFDADRDPDQSIGNSVFLIRSNFGN